jgi:hypothetical protein
VHLQLEDGNGEAVEIEHGGRLVAYYAGTLSASALWIATGIALLNNEMRLALPFSFAAAALTVVSNLRSREWSESKVRMIRT